MNYIVSQKYETNQKVYGKIAYNNLSDCLKVVQPGDYIYLCNEVYYGKIYVRCKDLTIIGMDDTIITYDAYHGQKIRECDGGDGIRVYGTTGSATMTIKPEASGFKMYNVCVQNTHKNENNNKSQAVAFKTEAQNGYYEECKFLGYQDTLYIDNSDNVFLKCLIAGTVDFIFGKGDAILDKCNIVIRSKDSEYNFICAPNTYVVNSYGLFFHKCNITMEDSNHNETYLGRPWFDIGAKMKVVPRGMFYECNFPSSLKLAWVKMRNSDREDYELYYYNCIQDNEHLSSIDDERIIDFYRKIYDQRRY